ncbi:hypothetical protein ACFV0R_30220 [Streptomyces sp. NPDC059578]|uniref:hypothetical protein n=1 Tax=Streptomyces sp. NPDC059578 TaxID=3346874 RepID=UPI0036AA8DF1
MIAGASVLCATGAWFVSEAAILRGLVVGASVVAVAGSVVMRNWDRSAGRRVAELLRARTSDEWRFEERVAEIEGELESARAVRGKLEKRLRAKRAELAALRGEHAGLLRRYATAETERASALEGRRQLAMETPAAPADAASSAATAPKALLATDEVSPVATVALYLRANAVLDRLERGAVGGPGRELPPSPPSSPSPSSPPKQRRGADAPAGAAAAVRARAQEPATGGHERAAAPATAGPGPAAGHVNVPRAAVAVVPTPPVRPRTVQGGFDFFGNKSEPARAALEAVQNEDLADVVGEEALALHKAESEADFKVSDDAERVGQVVDLTAHDETEPIDMQGLRSALRA